MKISVATLLIICGAYVVGIWFDLYGDHQGVGEPTEKSISSSLLKSREQQQRAALAQLDGGTEKQILFGDLHVHTTFSTDAFSLSLPILQGQGSHPPADACDFARYCSTLDFWAITDHAEGLTPRHWQETLQSVRACNNVASDRGNPDLVAFIGWEWTQSSSNPATHYGHKNVLFRDLDDDQIPARPIAASFESEQVRQIFTQVPVGLKLYAPLLDFTQRQTYFDILRFYNEIRATPTCPEGVPVRDLSSDCMESAATPRQLFDKLDEWGFDTLVIPHGTAWGIYTPGGVSWDKQIGRLQNDEEKQTLVEVYSGHGNSEEYRSWRAVLYDEEGNAYCPQPSADYLPECWRAGELIRDRCLAAAASVAECDERATVAKQRYLTAPVNLKRRVIPGLQVEDLLDAGQCRDCFQPTYRHRPGNSVQYALAISNFDNPEKPVRARYGFIASSDVHTARPGTGYKEVARTAMTDFPGPRSKAWYRRMVSDKGEPLPFSIPLEQTQATSQEINYGAWSTNLERQASFFVTGGLVAIHSESRRREAIWAGLKRKEVYGTSGERILLWFDLLNPGEGTGIAPMGSELVMNRVPRFRVRAIGDFKQKPGCPSVSEAALSVDRLQDLCRGECYHPTDERKIISHIEVVRIRPQQRPGEPVDDLIEDVWKKFDCPGEASGCVAEFSDSEFVRDKRDTVYYVRAIEEATPTIHGDPLRCEYDEAGNCKAVNPCWGDYRTTSTDDCLVPTEPRAWSSPIFVNYGVAETNVALEDGSSKEYVH